MKIHVLGKTYFVTPRRLIIAIALLCLFIGIAGWVFFGGLPEGGNDTSSGWSPGGLWSSKATGGGFGRPQPVSAGVARQMDVRVTVNALGTMSALNTATVRAKVDAELKALHFKEGALVKAGQVLVDLDTQNIEIQITQAQGQLERDTAQYKNAIVDLQRYKDLLSKDAIAAQQVDTQEALVRQLKGTVLIDQGQLDSARLQLSYAHVVAPISGRIGIKQVEIGSLLRSSDASGIATITQFQPIAAVFAVSQKYVPLIQKKLHEGTSLQVEVWDSELTHQLGKGKVSLTDNAIDTGTGTLKLKALLDNKDESLFPNQFVNIKLQLDVLKNTLSVPSSAVQRGALGTFVYVINPDNTVIPTVIKLLASDGDWQAIEGDVKPGALVVIDGADRLRAQSKVEITKTIDTGMQAADTGANISNKSAEIQDTKKELRRLSTNETTPPNNASGGVDGSVGNGLGEDTKRQKFLDRLPPEVLEKIKAMSPEERKAYFQKMRERRQQSSNE